MPPVNHIVACLIDLFNLFLLKLCRYIILILIFRFVGCPSFIVCLVEISMFFEMQYLKVIVENILNVHVYLINIFGEPRFIYIHSSHKDGMILKYFHSNKSV